MIITHQSDAAAQLGFLLGHSGAHLLAEDADAGTQAGQPVADAIGCERLEEAARPDHAVRTGGHARPEPHSPAHHAYATPSSYCVRLASLQAWRMSRRRWRRLRRTSRRIS